MGKNKNAARIINGIEVDASFNTTIKGELNINKVAGASILNFIAGTNDAGFIKHDESVADAGKMLFSVSDNDVSTDYFAFGNTFGGTFNERFKINALGSITGVDATFSGAVSGLSFSGTLNAVNTNANTSYLSATLPITVRNLSNTAGAFTGIRFEGVINAGTAYAAGSVDIDYTPGAGILTSNMHFRIVNAGTFEEKLTLSPNAVTVYRDFSANANNSYTSGTSALRWSNVYSVLGNFSGSLTTVGIANTGGYTQSGVSANTFTGSITGTSATFNSGSVTLTSTSANLTLTRAATNNQSNIIFYTGATVNWYYGTGANSTSNNLEWYNNNTASTGMRLDYADNKLTLAGALTGTSATFTGHTVFKGVNPGGIGANASVMDFVGNTARWFSYGANASTNGAFLLNSQRSDGSNSLDVLSISSAGAVTLIGALTGTSATFSGNIYQSNASATIASNNFDVYNGGSTDMVFTGNASGNIIFKKGGTTRYTIDASGNNTWTGTGYFNGAVTVYNNQMQVTNNTVTNQVSFSSGGGGYGLLGTTTNHALRIQTNAVDRYTIDASGNNTWTGYGSFTTSSAGVNVLGLVNSNASTPFGLSVSFSGTSPNNGTQYFISASDQSVTRFAVYSNGGISNYSANNVNLSDRRTKKEITPMESQWDIFKNIEFSKFKYKDQTHDDFNYGVVAQQVLEVAPHLVDVDGFGETPEDGVPLMAVYDGDIHYSAHKALQEALIRIEQLESVLKANNIQ